MPIYFFSRGKHVATALTAWDYVRVVVFAMVAIGAVILIGYGLFTDFKDSYIAANGQEKWDTIIDIGTMVLGALLFLILILSIVGVVYYIVKKIQNGREYHISDLPGIYKFCFVVGFVLFWFPLINYFILSFLL